MDSQHEQTHYWFTMAVEIMVNFSAELVTAFSTSVQTVSDQFLAKGLIADGIYKNVLETNRPSVDKARVLLHAIKDVIVTDDSYFETVLFILKEVLPLGNKNKLVLDLEQEYQKLQPSPKRNRAASDPLVKLAWDQTSKLKPSWSQSILTSGYLKVVPEIRVIQKFTPQLVSAVSSCVQAVSDQCLAKGLITEASYKWLLESTNTGSEDKARILLQGRKDSIKTDRICFEIFMSVLKETLPPASSVKLLSDIEDERKKLASLPTVGTYRQSVTESDTSVSYTHLTLPTIYSV